MTKYLLPLCAALLLLPTVALAAPASNDDAPMREIVIEDDDNIEGEVLKPGGVHVGGAAAKRHANMIGIRGEFIPMLIKLSNDV